MLIMLLWGTGSAADVLEQDAVTLSKSVLMDKIKGAWAAQTIGVTYGSPVEFKYNSRLIPDDKDIPWYDGYLKATYENEPGFYDDIYMDLTFVQVLEDQGLDAPALSFARAFANAEYFLWFANQQARYNVLNGMKPPATGHWLNNPCADDIDFQIEADFAGIMCPGMVNAAVGFCDTVGHIMNYGDGWYGGVYVAAMYSLAFVSNDIEYIVEQALSTIPTESTFARCVSDVIQWHTQDPDDWKATWSKINQKWGHKDIGTPVGVFAPFNIDAKINAAWVVMGLLYGDGDLGKTFEISTRCGDDADCNPATAGGVLATTLGYKGIPAYWKQGLAEVESLDFKYTTISLNTVYDLSFKHALEVIERDGGSVEGDTVTIKIQKPQTVPLEIAFKGHYPVKKITFEKPIKDELTFEFEGIGFAATGEAKAEGNTAHVFNVDMFIDGKKAETLQLPTTFKSRKFYPCWRYQLPMGKHTVRLKVLNPTDSAALNMGHAIIYADKPAEDVSATGKTYYIDSVNGQDASSGLSEQSAWQSLSAVERATLLPGDVVKFKRGSKFSTQLLIKQSGHEDARIVLTDYGNEQDPAPAFTNTVFSPSSHEYGNCIRVKGSYVTVENLYFHKTVADLRGRIEFETMWELGAVYIDKGAEHCIVRQNEMFDCGVGVKSYGEHCLITENFIHDCNRTLKEWTWGPLGVWLGGDYQEVSYNRFVNIKSTDSRIVWDGADGGAIEIDDARVPKSHISIHHNYSKDCQGFIEVTGSDVEKNPPYSNFIIHHNVSDDFQDFILLWRGAGFRIENNTILRRNINTNELGVFVITQENARNFIRNNIIIVEKGVQIFHKAGYKNADSVISNNLYYAVSGSLDMGLEGPGQNPIFEHPKLKNYSPGDELEDFALTAQSPAINKGLDLAYGADIVDAPIPQRGSADIGAFEFR